VLEHVDVAGAKRFEDLVAWQLSDQLKKEVYTILTREQVRRDFSFCDQLRESAASTPRNISEGFGRYRPRDFARFLDVAIGSLMETKNNLEDGRVRGHLTDDDLTRLRRLTLRATKATIRLRRYLLQCPDRR
jgi:four helix bundle protein